MFSGFKSLYIEPHEKNKTEHKLARTAPVDDVRRVKLADGAGDLSTVAARERKRDKDKHRAHLGTVTICYGSSRIYHCA